MFNLHNNSGDKFYGSTALSGDCMNKVLRKNGINAWYFRSRSIISSMSGMVERYSTDTWNSMIRLNIRTVQFPNRNTWYVSAGRGCKQEDEAISINDAHLHLTTGSRQ